MTSRNRIERFEDDIDLHLADTWAQFLAEAAVSGIPAAHSRQLQDFIWPFMRQAYGQGYCHAYTEEVPGKLCHDHGYRLPEGTRHPIT